MLSMTLKEKNIEGIVKGEAMATNEKEDEPNP